MFSSASLIIALLAVPFIAAAPVTPQPNLSGPLPQAFKAPGFHCPLPGASIDVPTGQALAVPSGTPKFVALGVGVQNYSCVAGVYNSVGAVASLYDISCAVGTPLMNVSNPAANTLLKTLATHTTPIISHFFVNQTGALSPRFNQEPFKQTGVFSTLSKTATMTSPQGSTNVAWLQLTNVVGTLANTVYRVDTQLGQPPATCNPTTDTKVLSVQYTAKYWFF